MLSARVPLLPLARPSFNYKGRDGHQVWGWLALLQQEGGRIPFRFNTNTWADSGRGRARRAVAIGRNGRCRSGRLLIVAYDQCRRSTLITCANSLSLVMSQLKLIDIGHFGDQVNGHQVIRVTSLVLGTLICCPRKVETRSSMSVPRR